MDGLLPLLWELALIGIVIGICMGLAGPMTWAERRQSAYVQDRVGPNRAAVRLFGREYRVAGLLHPLADAIKMLTKEDAIHGQVDRFLYNLAPVIALIPALVTFAVLPFGPDIILTPGAPADGVCTIPDCLRLQVARVDIGLLYIFAISSLAVFGVTLAGYASRSKLAMMGGLRASAQMISYEVTLGLSILGLALIIGTLEPYAIVRWQGETYWAGGWLPAWGIFLQPVAFFIFLTAAMAENKRVPFDLAEGESEIVGYFVEYSGMKFGMFFMAEYVEIIVIAGIVTCLFFGGFNVPYLMDTGFVFPWGMSWELNQWVVALLRIGAFFFKLLFFCWFQLMVRWTLPRFRYDQVMELGWRKLLPVSLLNLVVTAAVVLWVAG